MTLLPLALLLSLGAVPRGAACVGERVTLLPFDTVAVGRSEARRVEEAVRRALTRTEDMCLEPRRETVARLGVLGGRLEPCSNDSCRAAQTKALGAEWLIRGRVLGLGGERTVVLLMQGQDGREVRSTFAVPGLDAGAEDAATRVFAPLWDARQPRRAEARKTLRPWPQVLMGAGVAALAAGVGFGLAARSTERHLSEGAGGCEGEGEAFRRCFAEGLRRGERQSLLANSLLGTGAVLGAGGAILFVWELP
ncbi:hypothetical protein [Hyalangium rubrum]|uniref:Lipoprotein n=1 Tax=Hyalangium rubrum TaxID=3103134 RepID=A0ABU5HHZ2_9BACT|nr:hypothetical protein [Hyalangium sp. s54d21]MDY7233093.1 hypothetical protein [Hyalangium sp. s54d21]